LEPGDIDRQGAVALGGLRLPAGRPILLVLKFAIITSEELFAEPKGDEPPPLWIRNILVLTCTLVSFFHGSNDGQKGMGLIMLILIGTVPTAYALNRAMPEACADPLTRARNLALP
jgi:PiT family inorganic phosphate transporter